MKRERPIVVLAALIVQIMLLFAPAQGQESRKDLRAQSDYRRFPGEANRNLDWIISRAYDDLLRREPDEEGLRYYRLQGNYSFPTASPTKKRNPPNPLLSKSS